MKKNILLFLLFSLLSVPLLAATVEGVVMNGKKEPIIGATVIIKGTQSGTSTDVNGKFKLEVGDPKSAVLVVSFIGYKKKHVPLEGKIMLTILLDEDDVQLDELVVVGYGVMRKSDVTGSVTSIKTTEEESMKSISVDRMLQGKASGVTVVTGSSAPGGAVSIKIRGTSSLRGNNSPLYVVDGNILSADETVDPMKQGTGGGTSLIAAQNPLSAISPQDIESIEILKDASATAIYGSQGANGVILITTKKGKTSKPSVTINSTVTASRLAKEIPVLNTGDYISYYNYFLTPDQTPKTVEEVTPVNWQKESTRTALSQNFRASVSGKSNKTSYYIAAGYFKDQGVIKKTDVSQYDFRVNLDQEINNIFTLRTSTFFSTLSTSMTSGTDKIANARSSLVKHMILFKPFRTNGSIDTEYDEQLTEPNAWFSDYDDNSKDRQFNTNITLDTKITSWLTFQVKGGLGYRTKNRELWYGTGIFNGQKSNGKAGVSSLTNNIYNTQALFLFNKSLNKHNISGTLGIVYDAKDLINTSITGENFFSKVLRAKGISQAGTLYPFVYQEVGEQLFSVLSRLVYSYDNKYVLTGTFRADGSSKFTGANKFSYFPSFAFAWKMNQESFLSDVREISNLKLRLGWGQVGSQAVRPYQILSSYNNTFYSKPDGTAEIGVVPGLIANPNLKWETSEQYNVGLDLGLFNNALTFTAEAYVKNTKDLLQEIAIPDATGFRSMWINRGVIDNRGLEFSVNAVPVDKKGLVWTIGGNISFVKNKIKSLGVAPANFGMLENVKGYLGGNLGGNNNTKFPANIFLEGRALGMFLGYKTDGIMQEDEYNNIPADKRITYNGSAIMPGDIKFVDQNGDGEINEKDRVLLGDPNPTFTYALNTSLEYKRFTLSLVFNGMAGHDIINANLIDENDVKNSNNNVRRDAYFQAWTPENKSNTYPRLGYNPATVLTDRIVEKGDYLRLANISLSYSFKTPKSSFFKSLMVTGSVNNVFLLTNYSGYDPDVNTFANDPDRIGVDLASYPSSRSYILGVSVSF